MTFTHAFVASPGDVFVLDGQTGHVYMLTHGIYNDDDTISPGWNADFTAFLPDLPITRENVIATAEHRFKDLHEFLNLFARAE